MAPSRKSKSVNKRFINEASPDIDVGNSSKTKQRKKKLAEKLGPHWTRGELERFYDAYRKHGGDWIKVAAAVRNNRSADMVEAVFYMNRAYLSLPEGTASVAGLIAMMTDHYNNVMEGSESEGGPEVPSKHQKRKRAKLQSCDSQEVIPPHSIASAEGCLSTLRQIPAFVYERRASGIRTPRFPITITNKRDDREGSTPPNKRIKKQLDAEVDVALALADASRRGSPYRRTGLNDSTPVRLGSMVSFKSQGKEAQSKHCNSSMFENGVRISRTKPQQGMVDVEASRGKYSLGTPKKRNKKLLYGDELEALQALAELSVSLPPAGLMESESSALLKEERIANNMDEKSNTLETASTSHHREKAKQAEPEDRIPHAILDADNRISKSAQASVDGDPVFIGDLGTSKRKRKPKVLGAEAPTNVICNKELAEDDSLKTVIKIRRTGQGPAKQLKTAQESSSTSDKKRTGPDALVSATQVSGSDLASLPQKSPNRRKMGLKKRLQERAKSSETTPHNYESSSEHELLKEKASTCLSYPLVRRRCIFEWFYSAIDYPWFAKMEFIDYLNHVGLGHVPRLTRLEWSVIKSSLGRPRRFSERFLEEERDKLKQYRESVRKHYTELRAGDREGLPTDLARPLSVGNRVIAIHPKTREIRDGKILTVDHNKCNVLFDELGVELVMDIDCMPLNPLEYVPEGLRRQIDSKDVQLNSHASILFPPVLENASFSMKQDDMDGSILHGKVLATNTSDQPYITTNSKARGALMLQHTSDEKEMEPEMLGIVTGSKSIAQAMVDAAMKAASSVKKEEDARKMIQQALSEHESMVPGMKHEEHANGSLDHHPSNSLISEEGSGKNERQMPSELITSCVATWLMIQMCTEKQYPPADVAEVMERAVSSLHPRCPQNMPIYRDIQTCMGWIKTQIMALVRT